MVEFIKKTNSLFCFLDNEILEIAPWGPDGIRVRATRLPEIKQDWISALLPQEGPQSEIEISETGASLRNGSILAKVTASGELSFVNVKTGTVLLREQAIHRLSIPARHYQDGKGDLFHIDVCFEAYEDEHMYGLGQHQHGRLDQKGCVVELIQRNTEVSIPLLLSSRGYGFLWNNPAVGRVELGYNATRWVAEAAPQIDYWITTGDTPAEILSHYADVTGHAPMLPDWASGFWQSKLRYASQEELIAVAEEYHRRKLPLSVIVIDFFHWTRQGDWQFNPEHWPDPGEMVKKLESLGVRVMVSVWPTVSYLSPNYSEMWPKGYITRNKVGTPAHVYFIDNQAEKGIYVQFYDPTHPGARQFIWEKVKQGYYQHGIKIYWLDACEPEILPMNPENLRFHAGDGEAVANIYPLHHVQGFYEGMKAEGEQDILFLCRSAWAGSQRFGAAVWSGDVYSTFSALRAQLKAGLNMGLSGIPWWTHDIGGFHKGDPTDPAFRELVVRWFQFGAFSPLFRLHGHRLPNTDGFAGAANEVWSFGDEAYEILKQYMFIRERLRPYVMDQMRTAHEKGIPPMRPLFVDFPDDSACYSVDDQYMFGPDLLVAPVLDAEARSRRVYLPAHTTWKDAWTGKQYEGGQWLDVPAPIETIPLFLKAGSPLIEVFQNTNK
ncbi:MAG: glycoside hydrolase family 31 protein [Chloroflexi bacterium]|nr:MAG: glycoside hydrolase family 31 protein [Chloroflexota bacterium]